MNRDRILKVWFADGRIWAKTSVGGVLSRPLEAFPLLLEASDVEREGFVIDLDGDAIRWEGLDEDVHISSFYGGAEPVWQNEVAEMFARFPQINVSEFARGMGINKSLLSKYIYGIKTPSVERKRQIVEALHAMGRELLAVEL